MPFHLPETALAFFLRHEIGSDCERCLSMTRLLLRLLVFLALHLAVIAMAVAMVAAY